MAETYATQTASATATRVYRVELWGKPWKLTGIDAGGADGDGSTAYSVNPVSIVSAIPAAGGYTTAQKRGFYRVIAGLSAFGEAVDFKDGYSTHGSLTVRFAEAADDAFATLFAFLKGAFVASLSGNLSRTATSGVTFTASLTAGTAYFIGDECIVAKTTSATPSMARGDAAAKSLARAHVASTATLPQADNVYDHPRVWENCIVALYLGYDHADFDKTEERGPYLFRLDSLKEDARGQWTLTARSFAASLAQTVAYGQFRGAVPGVIEPEREVGSIMISAATDSSRTFPSWASINDRVWLAVDDELLEVQIRQTNVLPPVRLLTRGHMATGRATLAPGSNIREVVLSDPSITSPRIGYVPYDAGYDIADLVNAQGHPLIAALCIMLSRDGDLSNYKTAGDNNYDVLYPPWGLGLAAKFVDLDVWERVVRETPLAIFPRFVFGHAGAFEFLKWFNSEVAPFVGHSIATTHEGRVTLVRLGDRYPFESTTAITSGSMHGSYHGLDTGIGRSVGKVVIEFTGDDGGRRVIEGNSVANVDTHRDSTRTLTLRSAGASDATTPLLYGRSAALIARAEYQVPSMEITVLWPSHTIAPGSLISVTDAQLVDFKNGGRGVSSEAWRVLGVTVDPDRGVARLNCIRADIEAVHFPPAAKVTAWDAGTRTVTVEQNEFTPTTALEVVPNKDIKAFGSDGSQSNAGYRVMFFNLDLSLWNDSTDAIEIESISYSGYTCVISVAPNVATVASDPTGKIMCVAPYSSTIHTAVGAGTVSADLDKYLYLANDTTKVIATGFAARRWGA